MKVSLGILTAYLVGVLDIVLRLSLFLMIEVLSASNSIVFHVCY